MNLLNYGTCSDGVLRAKSISSAPNCSPEDFERGAINILVHLHSVKDDELIIPKNPVVSVNNPIVIEDEENVAPSTFNVRDTISNLQDREEYIDSGIKLVVKDVRTTRRKRKTEILEDLDIYGNFETILLTKRTSMKVIKKLDAFQISSCSWDAIEMKKSATSHSMAYQMMYTSCTSNISRTFKRQVRTVRDECVNRQNKYTFLPDYIQDSRHSELFTYDFFDRISGPCKWLSNVNIDVFAKYLKRLHDNLYLETGDEPPNITIISSSVFSPSSLNEVSEEPICKRTRNGGTASTHHSRTLINYDNAQWFLGPRSSDLPLRFRVGQDRVFIPFNRRGNHFALLYMFGPEKIIYYLDSLWSDGSPILRTLLRFLSVMASDC
jgi:hypothetical protein